MGQYFRLLFALYNILSSCPSEPAPFRSPVPTASAIPYVQAETLYEAVALAIRAFREHDCAPGAASDLDVEARSPGVTHTVRVAKVQAWLASSAKSPSDKIMKERLKGLLAS